ncbi:ferrochelatase [Pontibacter sp. G13]|uniref:ferrochelatase n=1 Tax=Pontibacter sp. G13 TaxID=3074898 RepID=UPI00288905FE|nr:ferrochelatase [Pontibacter sp. G13]WNJ18552.1 ferrochelatase [Pontibacter sp. G13]
MKRVAVVLLNLGGPNNEEAVQPFLYNLFMDEDIIKIPIKGGLKRGLIKFLTNRRAKTVSEKYKEINGCPKGCMGPKSCSNRIKGVVSDCCSSTNPLTEAQRRGLKKWLDKQDGPFEYEVITAMRYWHPNTDDALDELLEARVDEVVLLPMYPQFSYSTTASSLNEWFRRLKARNLEHKWRMHIIQEYHQDPQYVAAINERIDEALNKLDPAIRQQTHLLFSAHGTPISFREAGDPYSVQITATMESVMEARGKDRPYWLSYQSRVGPVKWLQPNTEEFLEVLYGYGIRHLVVIPIAFVNDHIETLMEVGIEFKEVADELGYETFTCMEGLNDLPAFIQSLGNLVVDKVHASVLPETHTDSTSTESPRPDQAQVQ